jgi:hypothetical protein
MDTPFLQEFQILKPLKQLIGQISPSTLKAIDSSLGRWINGEIDAQIHREPFFKGTLSLVLIENTQFLFFELGCEFIAILYIWHDVDFGGIA